MLEGLTINAIGDSYLDGNGLDRDLVWLSLLAKKYNIKLNNYGKNGSSISNVPDRNPMCVRYERMEDNDPDIVLIEGGRNDYNCAVALGETDSRDVSTFMGALNVVIEGIKKKYPRAMIVCITNWNYANTQNREFGSEDYANAMKRVADSNGVYCIMANDVSLTGVDMTSAYFRETYCQRPGDVSHLNSEGMKLVMPRFESLITECYKDFLSKK